jgi:kynurenine 3-monooxygenase
LFGDGAHKIFPFFGQDIIAALEDCTIISNLMDKHKEDWKTITENFEALRKPNTDAINELMKENF